MGGYEGADHRNSRGMPLELNVTNGHWQQLAQDHCLLTGVGIKTIQESVGWRASSLTAGKTDLSALRRRAEIARADYATPGGTGVRDYIHVQDLALGHVAAVRTLLHGAGSFTVNLGAGCGHSVLKVVGLLNRQVVKPCRIDSPPDGPVMSRPTTLMRLKLQDCQVGGHAAHCQTCAPMRGAGSRQAQRNFIKFLNPPRQPNELLLTVGHCMA